jgi:opacity protein-like surface antigen
MNATPIMGGIGYVFGTQDLHPYVMAHAGATLITVNLGANRPSEEINNEAYFTLGATAGVGYAASARLTITSSVRYTKMFREDLQTLSVLFGIAYHL